MLYRAQYGVLTVERQFFEGDVLARLSMALQEQGVRLDQITIWRSWFVPPWRLKLRVVYPTQAEAKQAERWIKHRFKV